MTKNRQRKVRRDRETRDSKERSGRRKRMVQSNKISVKLDRKDLDRGMNDYRVSLSFVYLLSVFPVFSIFLRFRASFSDDQDLLPKGRG